jgi:hypothetical protein
MAALSSRLIDGLGRVKPYFQNEMIVESSRELVRLDAATRKMKVSFNYAPETLGAREAHWIFMKKTYIC